tara:strand:+ start:59625 stop:59843 length:219 start_codon:yes stop_codon:yes gene_type:complete
MEIGSLGIGGVTGSPPHPEKEPNRIMVLTEKNHFIETIYIFLVNENSEDDKYTYHLEICKVGNRPNGSRIGK